ncbi:MMACHC [Cordylochernes scorpioides]|uniref:Cyanocobalamin reductase (cyanide-eliminating) n=1 Tax=Cordylochernes scorpioides TaxID=51811 RepID=A0ABY6K9A3_9ARAC|nr:MMACHC [Cordylochernes scorpioides]
MHQWPPILAKVQPYQRVQNASAFVIKTGSTTQWQVDLATKEMAASDMRNRLHVQLLLTWSTDTAHPVGWYNEVVKAPFRLPYDADTLGCVVLSLPQMFEHVFLPFAKEHLQQTTGQDPLDQCMRQVFQDVKEEIRRFPAGRTSVDQRTSRDPRMRAWHQGGTIRTVLRRTSERDGMPKDGFSRPCLTHFKAVVLPSLDIKSRPDPEGLFITSMTTAGKVLDPLVKIIGCRWPVLRWESMVKSDLKHLRMFSHVDAAERDLASTDESVVVLLSVWMDIKTWWQR